MTLIQTFYSSDLVIQVSDRRLITLSRAGGQPVKEGSSECRMSACRGPVHSRDADTAMRTALDG